MNLKIIFPLIVILVLPWLFALLLPWLFTRQMFIDPQQPLSILAMVILPFAEGFLLIITSSPKIISRAAYRIFMPWVPIMVFFSLAFLLNLEDCACWIIVLPGYLVLSSFGGLSAGYIMRKNGHQSIGGRL